jgi:hypothetical protein
LFLDFHNTENGKMELILEIKGEEERGNWVKTHNEDRSDLHGIWGIKCRTMRGGGHVARVSVALL